MFYSVTVSYLLLQLSCVILSYDLSSVVDLLTLQPIHQDVLRTPYMSCIMHHKTRNLAGGGGRRRVALS